MKTECLHSTQHAQKHKHRMHVGPALDDDRLEKVIDGTHHQSADGQQNNALHCLSHEEEKSCPRHPHNEGPYDGNQGNEGDDRSPEEGRPDAKRPEKEGAKQTLHDGGQDGTDENCIAYILKLFDDLRFVSRGQRIRFLH